MKSNLLLLATASIISFSSAAMAQDKDSAVKKDEETKDIVVTGTLIRGQAPTGSQLVQVDAQQIASSGISNSSQILGSVTQDTNFNNRPLVGNFSAFQTVNRPALRYLGATNSGGSSTLLLLNGHRMPGMGIFQTTPDLDAITPGAIERVDVVTEGGSATYGSDAVGGVMNIVSRRKYDGLDLGGHFGFRGGYNQWDVSTTAGHTFGDVSVWASYSYAHNDLIRNADRPYARNTDYIANAPADLTCSPGNVQQQISATASIYFPITNGVPSLAPGAPNRCDTFLNKTFMPETSRHSAMAGLSADLSDSVTFDVTAFYAHRENKADNGALTYTLPVNGAPGRSVLGDLSAVFGTHSYANTLLDTWGVTPQLTAHFGKDWRLVAFYNYGEGISEFRGTGVDTTALATAFATGAFNANTGTFTNSAAGQAAQLAQANRYSFNKGKDMMSNARVVIDGPLFALPGGDVRVALGGEILYEEYAVTSFTGQPGDPMAQNSNHRTVTSAFGELSVPLIGENNRVPGFYSLNLSASGRYDHYTDVGGTFNPKFGASWQPVEGWTIRGNWSRSFQAPSLAERNDVAPATLSVFPARFLGYSAAGSRQGLFLYPGSGPNLQPQKATTWEVGTDIKPAFLPGLTASATYYKIKFTDRIGNPPFFNAATFLSQFGNNYVLNPTSAQVANFIALASVGQSSGTPFVADPSQVYILADARSINLSSISTSGIDADIRYNHQTGFGSIFAQVAGSFVISFDQLAFPGGPTSNRYANQVEPLRLSTTAGFTYGDFMARATLQHTSASPQTPTAQNLNQSRLGALNVVNLAFSYTLKNEGALKDVMLSLNVDNLLDQDPPAYNGIIANVSPGYGRFTIGRVVQFGIRKKF